MANQFDTIAKEQTDLIEPLEISDRYDICPICKAQRLELMSYNNYPQNYRDAVTAYMRGYIVEFNRYEIRSLRCRSCNREFVIDWTYGFPVPLRDTYRSQRFFSEFYNGY